MLKLKTGAVFQSLRDITRITHISNNAKNLRIMNKIRNIKRKK